MTIDGEVQQLFRALGTAMTVLCELSKHDRVMANAIGAAHVDLIKAFTRDDGENGPVKCEPCRHDWWLHWERVRGSGKEWKIYVCHHCGDLARARPGELPQPWPDPNAKAVEVLEEFRNVNVKEWNREVRNPTVSWIDTKLAELKGEKP